MLEEKLKNAANAAFRDNRRLAEMSVGTQARLARLYNLERAKFLRGQVSRIASKARTFGNEIGFSGTTGIDESGNENHV